MLFDKTRASPRNRHNYNKCYYQKQKHRFDIKCIANVNDFRRHK